MIGEQTPVAPVTSPVTVFVSGASLGGRRPPMSCLPIAAFVFGLLPGPALGVIYSCVDASGRIILRDAPCKRSETSRDPERSARASKAASANGQLARTQGTITEAQVQQLVDGMDAAMTRRDVAAMLGYLAGDAVVEVEYHLPQGLQFKRFNKEEYAAHLRDAAELARAPDYRRENTQIVMASSAHYAELTTTMRQTIRVEGEPLSGVTRSKSMVELRDGRAQITLLRAVTTFDLPGQTGGTDKGGGANARRP